MVVLHSLPRPQCFKMFFPVLLAIHSALAPVNIDFYVGTYTSPTGSQGIYRVTLNTESGQLSEPSLAATAVNPSYVAISPQGHYLYAVNESGHGEVGAYKIGREHQLVPIGNQSAGGSAPCHVSVTSDGKTVFAANYSSGNVIAFPVLGDGSLGSGSETFLNTGSGPNRDRQEGPHMHSIQVDPKGRYVLAADLGTDELLGFPIGPSGQIHLADPVRTKTKPGAGPRHFDFSENGKFVYVANELNDTVGVYSAEAVAGKLAPIQEVPLLPDGVSLEGTTAAEIFLHPNGKWLYVSTRGYDSLVCFSIQKGGRLKLVQSYKLPVHFPRGFAIDPTGKWIVVGGQMSNDLLALKIDPKSGGIGEAGSRVALSSPVGIAFVR